MRKVPMSEEIIVIIKEDKHYKFNINPILNKYTIFNVTTIMMYLPIISFTYY